MGPERSEFYEANRPFFDDTIVAFEKTLLVGPSRILLYRHATQGSFAILEGEVSASDFEAYHLTEEETPEEAAEDCNELLQEAADMALVSLIELLDSLERRNCVQSESLPIPYEHAIWRRVEFEDGEAEGSVQALEILGAEGRTKNAALYVVERGYQGAVERTYIVAINGRVALSFDSVEPEEDELYDKCLDLFGEKSRAMDLFYGEFDSLEELRDDLLSIRLAAKGILPEAEVEAVLKGLAIRGRKSTLANIFTDQLGLDGPNLDKTKEMVEFMKRFSD